MMCFVLGAFLVSACDQLTGRSFDYETPVKRELRDPESAQFTDVEIGANVACGFVNSKNGYGGYAGRVPFLVRGADAETATAVVMSEVEIEHIALVENSCPEAIATKILLWRTDKIVEALK